MATELKFQKVAVPPAGTRRGLSMDEVRKTAKISMSNTEGGVKVTVRRNQVPVACLLVEGKTTEQRDEVNAFVRGLLVGGKLDTELNGWYATKKAREAAKAPKAKK